MHNISAMAAFGGSGGLFGTSPFSSVPLVAAGSQNNGQNVFGQPNKPFQWSTNATNNSSLFSNNAAFSGPTNHQAPNWNANNFNSNSSPFGGSNAFNFNNSSPISSAGSWNSNTNTAFQSAQPNVTQQPPNTFSFPGYTSVNIPPPAFGHTANNHVIPLTTPFGTGLCYFESLSTSNTTSPSFIQIPQANFHVPVSNSFDIGTHNRDYKDEVLAKAGIFVNPGSKDWEMLKIRLKRDAEEVRQKAMRNSENDSYSHVQRDVRDRNLPMSKLYKNFNLDKKGPSVISLQSDLRNESSSKIFDAKRKTSASWKTIKSSVITEREFSPLKQNNRRSLLDVGDSEYLCNDNILPFKCAERTGPPKRTYSNSPLSTGVDVTIIPECTGRSVETHFGGKRLHSVANLPHLLNQTSNEAQNIHQEFRPIPLNISTSNDTGLPANYGEGDYLYQSSGLTEQAAHFLHEGRTLRCPAQTMRPQQKTGHLSTSGQGQLRNCGVKLTMSNCYCCPDIATLDTMMNSTSQLCLVRNFEVGHYDYGKAVFDGIIDVSGVNLDEIVNFSPMVIDIYPEGSHKPPYGDKLNCPVTITLYNTYPKLSGIPITDPINLSSMRFDKTLMSACEKFGGVFVSYNMENGDWVFKVQQNMT